MPIRKSSFYGSSGSSGSSSPNGFYLYLGTSGNTNFTLVSPQPAGAYYITTEKSDTIYDIYAINASGDLVGYTTGNRLIATDAIAKISVIGGTSDDVLKFESKTTTFTTSTSNIDDGAPVFITSTSVRELESFDDTTVITGGNFATDIEVYFVGTNLVDLSAKNIVRNSASQLIATRPDNLIPDYAPYKIKLVNPGIPIPTTAPTQHILEDAITAGTYPVWVTTSPKFWEPGKTTSITLVAGDVESSDIDYQIIDGSLWPGFTLNQETGEISGDESALEGGDTTNFTVRATDTAGNYSDRNFDFIFGGVSVYGFFFDPFVQAAKIKTPLLFDMNI